MNAQEIRPDDAARALAEIRGVQERVVDANLVPDWFWYALGVLVAGFVAAVDSQRVPLLIIASVLFPIGIGVVVTTVARRARPQLRPQLLGVRGAVAIAVEVLLLVGVGLGVRYGLAARDVAAAETYAGLAVGVLLAATGPLLMRYLRSVVLANGSR